MQIDVGKPGYSGANICQLTIVVNVEGTCFVQLNRHSVVVRFSYD